MEEEGGRRERKELRDDRDSRDVRPTFFKRSDASGHIARN